MNLVAVIPNQHMQASLMHTSVTSLKHSCSIPLVLLARTCMCMYEAVHVILACTPATEGVDTAADKFSLHGGAIILLAAVTKL